MTRRCRQTAAASAAREDRRPIRARRPRKHEPRLARPVVCLWRSAAPRLTPTPPRRLPRGTPRLLLVAHVAPPPVLLLLAPRRLADPPAQALQWQPRVPALPPHPGRRLPP